VHEGARFSADGFPLPYFIYSDQEPWVEHAIFDGISDKYSSNIALANYFDPADHEGEAPAGLSAQFARPFYTVDCLDDAGETIAHIRLTVREWNEEAEYFALGDPDTSGREAGFQAGLIEIDDRSDWATETPDAVSYPELPVVSTR
jgi:hypothetical protein